MQKRHEKSRLRATFRRKLRYKRLFTQSKQAAGNQCCFCALTSASAAALVAMARSLARASAGQLGLGGLDVGLGLLEVGGGTHHFELGVGLLLILRLPQLGDLFQRLVLGLRHEGDHAEEADQVGASGHQEGAHTVNGADQHRSELSDGPVSGLQKHGADTGGAATQIGGEELRDHNPRNRAHREGEARGEAHHEDEHAQLVVVRVGEGDAKREQHHEAGADRHELLTAGGIIRYMPTTVNTSSMPPQPVRTPK